jgi:ABC transporter substrate binding protein
MYTRSDLALYRISIVDLPFPVKDVNGYGDYNISFDSEKDFDFFLLIVSAVACLVKVKDFALARTWIAELAVRHRLPTISDGNGLPEVGALMLYGPDRRQASHRAAHSVDKILKGRKSADLPVEQPTKFEFVINLKTAKQIGLTIPPEVLARATKIIR